MALLSQSMRNSRWIAEGRRCSTCCRRKGAARRRNDIITRQTDQPSNGRRRRTMICQITRAPASYPRFPPVPVSHSHLTWPFVFVFRYTKQPTRYFVPKNYLNQRRIDTILAFWHLGLSAAPIAITLFSSGRHGRTQQLWSCPEGLASREGWLAVPPWLCHGATDR